MNVTSFYNQISIEIDKELFNYYRMQILDVEQSLLNLFSKWNSKAVSNEDAMDNLHVIKERFVAIGISIERDEELLEDSKRELSNMIDERL